MKKSLLATLPVVAFVAGMAVVPSVFAAETVTVADEGTLSSCVETAGNICKLSVEGGTLTLNSPLEVAQAVTIDLNGQTLTRGETGDTVIYVQSAGNLTVTDSSTGHNGTVKIENANSQAVYVQGGGKLTVNNGNFSGARYGIVAVATNPSVTINDGAITGGHTGIAIFGDGANVEVNGGSITGTDAFAIAGNGADTTNSAITINNGTLSSANSAAIYNPQSGTLDIKGGSLTGVFGVVARQGTINITGGTITTTDGEGVASVGDAKADGENVQLPKGVAVLVDNTEKYGGGADPANVKISGDVTINAKAENPVLAYGVVDNEGDTVMVGKGVKFTGTTPNKAYLGEDLIVGPNGVVMTEAEAEAMARQEEENTANPNTADPVALYVTIAAVALVGLGATVLVAKKSRR